MLSELSEKWKSGKLRKFKQTSCRVDFTTMKYGEGSGNNFRLASNLLQHKHTEKQLPTTGNGTIQGALECSISPMVAVSVSLKISTKVPNSTSAAYIKKEQTKKHHNFQLSSVNFIEIDSHMKISSYTIIIYKKKREVKPH